ncbi:glycosyltransferase family 4 protein [Winogradskyella litoriviva]|uniref:Glycosyltransferase family 4 protein n=1 Tax=Winogradskyella litoriviva TaxID=1220182 RepID=A0ABX2E6A0_9FLAO|nr:glycosyltransferase [Winogradskyella litoriviva]NRD23231.1 glycosyltransferase family 4 protein [Winogradskyella litoriviva]
MNILVLYTRLTGYWLACMRKDFELNKNNYLVFRTAPSKDAPFKIESENGISICNYSSEDFSAMEAKIEEFKPSLIYIAGWSNKNYLKIAKSYKSQEIPIVAGMDNQWLGTFRQQIASVFSKFLIHKYFTHIWVAGKPQYYYARKLGFKTHRILTGLYSADETVFENIKQTQLKKQIIFVGRLVEHKGLRILFKVLNELIKSNQLNIDVQFIGNGPLANEIPQHKNVKHRPFVSPDKLPILLENAGYFILPSLYEAWGVVIHEAVLAGLPVITTHETGAASDLVINNFNGFVYEANDGNKLMGIIKSLELIDNSKYLEMSKNSKLIATKINLTEWSASMNSIINT